MLVLPISVQRCDVLQYLVGLGTPNHVPRTSQSIHLVLESVTSINGVLGGCVVTHESRKCPFSGSFLGALDIHLFVFTGNSSVGP